VKQTGVLINDCCTLSSLIKSELLHENSSDFYLMSRRLSSLSIYTGVAILHFILECQCNEWK